MALSARQSLRHHRLKNLIPVLGLLSCIALGMLGLTLHWMYNPVDAYMRWTALPTQISGARMTNDLIGACVLFAAALLGALATFIILRAAAALRTRLGERSIKRAIRTVEGAHAERGALSEAELADAGALGHASDRAGLSTLES